MLELQSIYDIPSDLGDGEMVYVISTNEIYIKTNNKLTKIMSSIEEFNWGDSILERERIKELIKEVLYSEDDEISEIRQLFINCLAQHLDKYLDRPETLIKETLEDIMGVNKTDLQYIRDQVFQFTQVLSSSSIPPYYTLASVYSENLELKDKLRRLESEMSGMKSTISMLLYELRKN